MNRQDRSAGVMTLIAQLVQVTTTRLAEMDTRTHGHHSTNCHTSNHQRWATGFITTLCTSSPPFYKKKYKADCGKFVLRLCRCLSLYIITTTD